MGKKTKKKAAKAAAKAAVRESAASMASEPADAGARAAAEPLDVEAMPSAASCAVESDAETKQEDAACRAAGVQNVDAAQGAVDRGDTPAAVGSDVEGLGADAACPASDAAAATGSCCACRQKQTERTAALQADVQKRLNRVIGQLNGIKSMVESNRYCGDVLIQLAASEAAVHRVSEIILQDHMETCVVEQIREGNVEVVDEAMKLIKKFM